MHSLFCVHHATDSLRLSSTNNVTQTLRWLYGPRLDPHVKPAHILSQFLLSFPRTPIAISLTDSSVGMAHLSCGVCNILMIGIDSHFTQAYICKCNLFQLGCNKTQSVRRALMTTRADHRATLLIFSCLS